MKQICEYWDNACLTFSYQHFEYIFYVEQFLVNYRKLLEFKELISEIVSIVTDKIQISVQQVC